jgi:hypothetical protein
MTKPALAEVGFDAGPGEPVPTTLLRTRLYEWTCNHGDPQCIADAKTKFTQWTLNPANTSA